MSDAERGAGGLVAPYGSWRSPIDAARVAREGGALAEPALTAGAVYWLERRPAEGGRQVVVRCTRDGGGPGCPSEVWSRRDLLPAPWNARNRTHEYGGGSYCTTSSELFFTEFGDQCVYRLSLEPAGAAPRRVTAPAETPAELTTYADLVWDPRRDRLVCVREQRSAAFPEPRASLVAITGENQLVELAAGHDFYASPRLSPSGDALAWLTWDHPRMPWEGSELWLATLERDGSLGEPRRVAGGPAESVFQPDWSPDSRLYFVSDRSGFWNLYRLEDPGSREARALCPRPADFGLPQWVFGQSTYALPNPRRLFCTFCEQGRWRLLELELDLQTGEPHAVDTPYTEIEGLRASPAEVVFLGASPSSATALVRLDLKTRRCEELFRLTGAAPDPTGLADLAGLSCLSCLSEAEPIEFASPAGKSYGFFYPPRNDAFRAPAGELPPLLVKSHGGPTSQASSEYQPGIQFWTSRGFAVVDVNYGGSSGFGREYRNRLAGRWGIVDVLDCIAAAQALVAQGRVDPERLIIRGGSAGGYTTLAALTLHDVFHAGASHYGIGDLEALARDTHKFESRYLDSLIGPYPERRDLYRERSPIHHLDRLGCPVIFFQGLEDRVVPPSQAEAMVEALRQKGLPVAYLAFAGEQHGFRKAENIERCLLAELYFYSRVFGFDPADPVAPLTIENL